MYFIFFERVFIMIDSLFGFSESPFSNIITICGVILVLLLIIVVLVKWVLPKHNIKITPKKFSLLGITGDIVTKDDYRHQFPSQDNDDNETDNSSSLKRKEDINSSGLVSITDRIIILRQPFSTDQRPALLNPIVIRILDKDGEPISDKKVTVSLIDTSSLKPKNYLQGTLETITDSNGNVELSDLSVSRSGVYRLLVVSDYVEAKSKVFQVTPPGLDTNFSQKEYGSKEYIAALKTAIRLNTKSDKVVIYDEEIK